MIASFGFIIALVWRDAIKSGIDEFLIYMGIQEHLFVHDVISAAIVTVIVIAIMVFVTKLSRGKQEKRVKENIRKISKEIGKNKA